MNRIFSSAVSNDQPAQSSSASSPDSFSEVDLEYGVPISEQMVPMETKKVVVVDSGPEPVCDRTLLPQPPQPPPPPPPPQRHKSLQLIRHWVDPTVQGGVFYRCLNMTCRLKFAGYMMAASLTIVLVAFSITCLFLWRFDIPRGGNSLCYSILAASLALWAKPVRKRRRNRLQHHPR